MTTGHGSPIHVHGTEATILIADDHPIVRTGLREIIERKADLRVVAECGDGEQALETIRNAAPDLAILDIEMPGLSGLDVAAVVHRDQLATRMIFLTITDSPEVFNQAIEYGVTGYVLKDSAVPDLTTGIREVLAGRMFFSPSLMQRVRRGGNNGVEPSIQADTPRLTRTERKVLRFIAENMSTREIAGLLDVSIRTVDSHREHISRKLGLHGSYALVRYALQHKEQF